MKSLRISSSKFRFIFKANSNCLQWILFTLALFFSTLTFSQSIAINEDGSSADTSAILEIKSNAKGLLLPRMNKTEKNGIVLPATGLLIFQTGPDSIGFHYYNGTSWLWIDPLVNNAWKITGNTGTDTATHFIGTNNNMPLRFRQNNIPMAFWDLNKGNYFIGEAAGKQQPVQLQNSIAIGDSAFSSPGDLISSSASDYNIAIGYKALKKHFSQIGNIAIGAFSMMNFVKNPGGNFGTVAIGYQSHLNSRSGDGNVSIGAFANFTDTGSLRNTAVGFQALALKVSGNLNTALGQSSGISLRAGARNTFVGSGANVLSDSLVNATAIGANAQVDTSNAMVLGSISGLNGATANTNVAIGTIKPKAALHVSRGSYGGSFVIPASRTLIVESNASSYIQLLHPTISESGILAGNTATTIKSALIFTADSSVQIRAGGGASTNLHVDNSGNVGIGTVNPNNRLHVSVNQLPGAKYGLSPVAVFENGNPLGNSAIQLMNTSAGDFSIFSGTELTFSRSQITFNNDSSVSIGAGGSLENFRVAKNGNVGINSSTPTAKLDVAGNFKIGSNGTINNAIIKDTVIIDLPLMAADNEQTITVALPGVTTNGAVSVSPGGDLPSGISIMWARVSSAGNVRIRFRNVSASSLDTAAMNYYIMVLQ